MRLLFRNNVVGMLKDVAILHFGRIGKARASLMVIEFVMTAENGVGINLVQKGEHGTE